MLVAWSLIPVRRRWRGCAIAAGMSVVVASGCSSAPQAGAVTQSVSCSTQVAAGKVLSAVRPVTATVPDSPTAMVGTPDGRWAFASLANGDVSGAIAVLGLAGGALRLIRTVPLPSTLRGAYGMTLTHDGRLLLVAGYSATAVLSVSAFEDGRGDPVDGLLTDAGNGQFGVTVSADDRYVFVTDELSYGLSVFDLTQALRSGFTAPGVAVGVVPLGDVAGAAALSPDGKLLYVTTGSNGTRGQLWVLSTARTESGAAIGSVLAHVSAGCQPVRVAVSPDGSTAWVTARTSNALLAFSTADLLHDPSHALRAVIQVGSEPVGVLLADNGRIALVSNSNRGVIAGSAGADTPQTISVISTADALAHRTASLGAVQAGLFPRDLSYDPATGQVLLANFNSGTVEEFPVPEG